MDINWVPLVLTFTFTRTIYTSFGTTHLQFRGTAVKNTVPHAIFFKTNYV